MKAEEAADVWSLGLVCFELFRGRPLFGDELADDHVIAMLLGYVPASCLWLRLSIPRKSEFCTVTHLHSKPKSVSL